MDLIDIGLIGSYILIGLCTLSAIIIPLVQAFGDPKSLVKSGLGVAVMVVVFFGSYLMGDGSTGGIDETTSKLVDGGIITTYVFFFAAIWGIVYTEVSKIFS